MEIPTEPLETPLGAWALNGLKLFKVLCKTILFPTVISGNHCEEIVLHLIDCPCSPLVLGYLRLSQHNPQINWTKEEICSWSTNCHAHCLRSAKPLASPVSPIPPQTLDLSLVPAEHHDLAAVFSKEEALSLSPLCN